MRRRLFIVLSGVGVSAGLLSLLKVFDVLFADANQYAKPELLSQICDDQALRALGEVYLGLVPADRNRENLIRDLLGPGVDVEKITRGRMLSVCEQLKHATRDDFRAGRIVILDGWVLSLTEARQCALFAIINT